MTRKEAIEQLINDFINRLIARGETDVDTIEDETDRKIARALKIKKIGK